MQPVLWTFNTTKTETTPPTVVSLSPAEGSIVDAASVTKLVITFSEPMFPGYQVYRLEDKIFPTRQGVAVWINNTTFEYPVEPLKPGTSYGLWINIADRPYFRDLQENPLAPMQWTFSTKP